MHIIIIKRRLIKKYLIGLAIVVLVLIAILIVGKNVRNTFMFEKKVIPIYSVETKDKKIAITFDTSWGVDNTKPILDVLKQEDVKATFFLIGKWVEEYPQDARLIASMGNEIGNHSDSHQDFTKLSKEQILSEINSADAKIMGVTGIKTSLFRFPEGTYNSNSVKVVEDTKHKCIQWDADSIDWKNEGYEVEYKRVIKNIKNGSIILFHNSGKYTPKTVDMVIKKFKSQGYSFVKVSDLIYKENYILDENGRQIKK